MEPNANQFGRTPERSLPTPEVTRPATPEVSSPASPEKSTETREVATGAGRGDNPPPLVPVGQPLPPLQQPVKADDSQATSVVDDTPSAAADDDLIEKEWVDKAKQIISETKDDPYAQEKAVNKLQADYLKKRYGHSVKLSDS